MTYISGYEQMILLSLPPSLSRMRARATQVYNTIIVDRLVIYFTTVRIVTPLHYSLPRVYTCTHIKTPIIKQYAEFEILHA